MTAFGITGTTFTSVTSQVRGRVLMDPLRNYRQQNCFNSFTINKFITFNSFTISECASTQSQLKQCLQFVKRELLLQYPSADRTVDSYA
jgi:hypothetical protein